MARAILACIGVSIVLGHQSGSTKHFLAREGADRAELETTWEPWIESTNIPLVKLWTKLRSGQDVVITTMGGSSAAGGGRVGVRGTVSAELARLLNTGCTPVAPHTHCGQAIDHNVAQGTTTSFWATHVFDSLAESTDVLIWEYAINDATGNAASFVLESWLRKTEVLGDVPIYLIYAALQDQSQAAWKSQATVRREYTNRGLDLTSINLYLHARSIGVVPSMLLADHHHPNREGHALLAKLVHQHMLQAHESTVHRPPLVAPVHHTPLVSTLPASCTTADEQLLLQYVGTLRSTSKLAWEPHLPRHSFAASMLADTKAPSPHPDALVGVVRFDKKLLAQVPCCRDGGVTLDLGPVGPVSALQWRVEGAVQYSFGAGNEWLRTSGRFASMSPQCFLSKYYAYFQSWMVFSTPLRASTWTMCSSDCARLAGVAWMVAYGTGPEVPAYGTAPPQAVQPAPQHAAPPVAAPLATAPLQAAPPGTAPQQAAPPGTASPVAAPQQTAPPAVGGPAVRRAAASRSKPRRAARRSKPRRAARRSKPRRAAGISLAQVECVVEPHTWQAGVLAAVLCVAVFAVAWLLPPADAPADGRSAHLDNAKYLAIVLIVLAHWLDAEDAQAWPWRDEVKRFLKFHTRVFCFVSGVVTQRFTPKSLENVVVRILVPAAFWCLLLQPILFPILQGRVPGIGAIEQGFWLLLFPQGPVWYLYALALWRVLAYALRSCPPAARLAVAVGLAAAAGDADLRFLRIGTGLQFFPIFVVGQLFPLDRALAAAPLSAGLAGAGAVALAAAFAFETAAGSFVDGLPDLQGWYGMAHCSHAERDLYWLRGLARNALEATKALVFLVCCCPREASALSTMGMHSLYPFLLHWPLLIWRARLLPLVSGPPPVLWATAVFGSALIAGGLTTWPVRSVFGLLLEPTWLQRK